MTSLKNVSDEDLLAYQEGRFQDISDAGLLAIQAVVSPPPKEKKEPIGKNLVQQLTKRGGTYNDATRAAFQGEQSIPETLYQYGGNTIGAAGDIAESVITETADLAARGIDAGVESSSPFTSSGQTFRALSAAKELPGMGLRALGALPSAGGGTLAEAVPSEAANLAALYNESTSPREKRNYGAAGNYLSVLPFGRASRAAAEGIESGSRALRAGANKIEGTIRGFSADAEKAASVGAYKSADDVGATLKPKFIDDVIETVQEETTRKGEGPQIYAAATKDTSGEPLFDASIEGLEGLRGRNITLDEFDDIDKQITQHLRDPSVRNEMGELLPAGQKIKTIQDSMREIALNADESVVNGGTKGFEQLKKARDLYRKQVKMREIEEILKISSTYQQPANAIKRRLSNLANSKKGKSLYSEKEREALLRAAETGRLTELANAFGSRLGSSMAVGLSDPVTAVGLRIASEYPRGAAEGLMARKAQGVIDLIGRGSAPQTSDLLRTVPASALRGLATAGKVTASGLRARAPQVGAMSELQQYLDDQKQSVVYK